MQFVRPKIAQDQRRFGKGQARAVTLTAGQASALSHDLKLFATTFLAGFLFVSILIG
jgi:hypothetical protein